MSKICIFAGTSEGRKLLERLCGRGLQLTVCVATEYGEVLLGDHPDKPDDAKDMVDMLVSYKDIADITKADACFLQSGKDGVAASCVHKEAFSPLSEGKAGIVILGHGCISGAEKYHFHAHIPSTLAALRIAA